MKIVYAAVLVGILTATYFVENWQTALFTTGAVLLFLGAKFLERKYPRTK